MMTSIGWTSPGSRGCGAKRTEGGVYLTSGGGMMPISYFYQCPPVPVPEGLDLTNKTRVLMRTVNGEPVINPATGLPFYDVYMVVGAKAYPHATDFLEEAGYLGVSRKVSPKLPLEKLTQGSFMLIAHPNGIPANWHELLPPTCCPKRLEGHDQSSEQHTSHCIAKLWDLTPPDDPDGMIRQIACTCYPVTYTGEQVTSWIPAFILKVPISGVELPRKADGSVNAEALEKLEMARRAHKQHSLNWAEMDR